MTEDVLRSLRRMGLLADGAVAPVTPLSGGVSCDVWRVDLPAGPVCVKRALAKLRVQADWRAPVERAHNEVNWIRYAATIAPHSVPTILGEDLGAHMFVMNFFEPEHYPVWKALLRDGKVDAAFTAVVGDTIGAIHAASAGRSDVARTFDSGDLFMALRIEPYLLYTANAHPDRGERIRAMASGVEHARIALMHGDVSPKNILFGPDGPVLLDAETACYGDPAFDLAFCLNHLLLKCVWVPHAHAAFLDSFTRLRDAYLARVGWEPAENLDRRTAGLLSAMLLARIDGKSPVEYITTDRDKDFVRSAARDFLERPVMNLADIRNDWLTRLGTR